VNPLEIRIYNTHLAISRSLRNKPFQLKKSFEGFEKDPKYLSVKRLFNFFSRYPEIDLSTYFMAPYKLYPDVDYFDLNYFASPRAIKSYTLYKQFLQMTSPDQQMEDVKKSLLFISKFCIKNQIQLHDYLAFKETGSENSWVYHFKKNEINAYSLMEFSDLSSYINEMAEDTREFFLGDFGKNFLNYRQKYINSEKLKPFLSSAFLALKLFIDKNLNFPQNHIKSKI
jgi:hypothetical protein